MTHQKKPETIDEYIMDFPDDIKTRLNSLRTAIQQQVPEAEEAISYAIPTFKWKGKNLVHFAAFKHHIGFYPTPTGVEAFQKDLAKYKQGKGSVQFPNDEPLPVKLVLRIVSYNVKRLQEKPTLPKRK